MTNQFRETTHQSFGQRLFGSIIAVPLGILLFLASFPVLWFNEGRTNYSKEAERSEQVEPASPGGHDGQFVSVTGAAGAPQPLGDPEFVSPGPWVRIARSVEMFAWVERKSSSTSTNTGGSSTTTTTYDYVLEWTSDPEPASEFRYPDGHSNPPLPFPDADFTSPTVTVGAWSLDSARAALPAGPELALDSLPLTGRGLTGIRSGNYLYFGSGNTQVPNLGDVRVHFSGVAAGANVTAFGQAQGGQLVPVTIDEDPWLRVLEGSREEAIATLAFEYKMAGWIFRILGFFLMWMGMGMALGPVSTFLDILPFLGKMSRGLIGIATFPIALVLTTVTVVISMILHSVVAIAVILAALVGLVAWALVRKSGRARQPA